MTNLFEDHQGIIYADLVLDMLNVFLNDSPGSPPKGCSKCIDFLRQMQSFQDAIFASYQSLNEIKSVVEEKVVEEQEEAMEQETVDEVEIFPYLFTSGDSNQSAPPIELIEEAEETQSSIETKTKDSTGNPSTSLNVVEDYIEVEERDLFYDLIEYDSNSEETVINEEEIISSPSTAISKTINFSPQTDNVKFISKQKPTLAVSPSPKKPLQMYLIVKKLNEPPNSHPVTPMTPVKSTRPVYVAPEPSKMRQSGVPTADELNLEQLMVEMHFFVCNVCNLNQYSYWGLTRHVRKFHLLEEYRHCCNKALNNVDVVYNHFRAHRGDVFACKDCGRRLRNADALRIHRLTFHTDDQKKHFCRVCKLYFLSILSLENHMRTHMLKTCEYCGMKLIARNLKRHIQLKHDKSFLCELCGKGYPTNMRLRQHMKNYHGLVMKKNVEADKRPVQSTVVSPEIVKVPIVVGGRPATPVTEERAFVRAKSV